MQSINIDYKKEKIEIKDQNKKLIWFIRFILIMNILNSILFYIIFNNQQDIIQWIWFVFAILNVIVMYLSLTKLSFQDKFDFTEIKSIKKLSFLGLFIQLHNGKYRKIFISEDSNESKKLINQFKN